jgi:hypothetical protein
MAWIELGASMWTQGEAIKSTNFRIINNNMEWLYQAMYFPYTGVPNGDFELFDDDGAPLLWSITTAHGGDVVCSTVAAHGGYAACLNHDGDDNALVRISSMFIPISTLSTYTFQFISWTDDDGAPAKVRIEWYKANLTTALTVGRTTFYEQATHAASPTLFSTTLTPPASAAYGVIVSMLSTVAGPAGNLYIDNVKLYEQ